VSGATFSAKADATASEQMRNVRARIDLTRRSSATAGGSERGKHVEPFHKIKSGHRDGQRLAGAIG
jgi:hypothetical protein